MPPPLVVARRATWCQLRPAVRVIAGKDGEGRPRHMSSASTTAAATAPPGGTASPAPGLSCRECGKACGLGACSACDECFGPLEVRYGLPRVTRSEIEAGPPNI